MPFFREYNDNTDMSVGTLVAVIATFKMDGITPCVLELMEIIRYENENARLLLEGEKINIRDLLI